METKHIIHGDNLTPIGMQLKHPDTDGTLVVTDLSALTTKVFVVDDRTNVVVTETTTGVTEVDASNGKITYDFQSSLPPGTYYVYARVYSGDQRDTYPDQPAQMRVVIGYAGA